MQLRLYRDGMTSLINRLKQNEFLFACIIPPPTIKYTFYLLENKLNCNSIIRIIRVCVTFLRLQMYPSKMMTFFVFFAVFAFFKRFHLTSSTINQSALDVSMLVMHGWHIVAKIFISSNIFDNFASFS